MSQYTEYAKVSRVAVTTSNVYGVEATLQLPSQTKFNGGYANFYLGLGPAECGVSTKTGKTKWHWFANASGAEMKNGDDGTFTQYSNGSSIKLKLVLNSSGYICFHVNGANVRTFTELGKYTPSTLKKLGDPRFVMAGCSKIVAQNPTPTASSLGDWTVYYTQATFSNMKYYTSPTASTSVTSNNAKAINIKWPVKSSGAEIACNKPEYATFVTSSLNSSIVYQSMKYDKNGSSVF